MPRLTRWFQQVYAVLSLIIFAKAFTILAFTDLHEGRDKSLDLATAGPVSANQIELLAIYSSIYLFTGFLLLRRYSNFLKLCQKYWLLIALVTLTFISAAWSVDPILSLARSIALTGTTMFGMYLALVFDRSSQLGILATSFSIIILGSCMLIFWLPEQGTMNYPHWGLWNGAFVHKNMMGMTAVFSSVSLFLYAATSTSKTKVAWLLFALSIFLLIGSLAKTAAAAFVATFSLMTVIFIVKEIHRLAIISAAATLLVAIGFALQIAYEKPLAHALPELLSSNYTAPESECSSVMSSAAIGDKCSSSTERQTLQTAKIESIMNATGRVYLWRKLVPLMKEHILIGFGFGGFWTPDIGPFSQKYSNSEWIHSQAHNGYIEVVLDIGVLGLLAILYIFVSSLYSSIIKIAKQTRPIEAVLPFALLITIGVMNIAESQLLMPNSISWIILTMIVGSLSSAQSDRA